MGFTTQQKALLNAKIPRDQVKQREGGDGKKVEYITGHYAIEKANEIFGADGWADKVLRIEEVYRGTRPGRNGENIVLVFKAHMRINACGVVKEDVGVGTCDSGLSNLAQSIEKAQKEAVTDGIKRCLRQYGNALGLALYDKSGDGIGHSTLALDLLEEVRGTADVDAWVATNRELLNGKDLDGEERAAIREAVAARKTELAAAPKPAPADGAPEAPAPQPVALTLPVASLLRQLGTALTVDEVLALLLSNAPPPDAAETVRKTALARAVALDEQYSEEALEQELAQGRADVPDPKPWGVWGALLNACWGARDLAALDAAVSAHGPAAKGLPPALKARANALVVSTRIRLRAERAASNAELQLVYEELRAQVQKGVLKPNVAAWLTEILNREAGRIASKAAA